MTSHLPNAKQQFIDANGKPYAGGFVYMYIPSTTTFKNTWQDVGQTILNTNPIVLDAAGEAIIYGSGQYRQQLYDVNNNLIWDQLTEDTVFTIPNATESAAGLMSAADKVSLDIWEYTQNGYGIFQTVAAATAKIINAAVQGVYLLGYFAVGDGGAAAYVRSTTSGAGNGRFQSADGAWWQLTERRPSPPMFGAIANGVQVTGNVSINSGTNALTVNAASFTAADVGKAILIPGAGAAGAALTTTISAYISPVSVSLGTNASTTLSSVNETVSYGTDCTTGLNAFFAYVGTNNATGYITAGISIFTQPLNAILHSRWGVQGAGSQYSLLLYCGTTLNQDLLVVGDGTNGYSFVRLGGFRIDSAVVLTAGTAIHSKILSFSDYTDIECGLMIAANSNKFLFHGIWFDQVQWTTLVGFKATVIGKGCSVNGGLVGTNAEFFIDQAQIAYCGSYGLHIGGGIGGVYTGYVSLAANAYGIFVDTSLTATNNRELFFGPLTAVDSSVNDNVYINQNVNSGIINWYAWTASAQGAAGKGITIAAFLNGAFNIYGGKIFNNKGDGVYVGDASCVVRANAAVDVTNNGGFGFNGISTNNVFSDSQPAGNTNGDYASTLHVKFDGAGGGYRKYANGDLHQWGNIPGNAGADTAVTFLVPFTTLKTLTATIGPTVSGTTVLESPAIYSISTTGFTGGCRAVTGSVVARGGEQVYWNAWGV